MTSSICDIFANDKVMMTTRVFVSMMAYEATTRRVDFVELSMWLHG